MAPYGACEVEQSKAEAVLLNEEKGFLVSKVSLDCLFGAFSRAKLSYQVTPVQHTAVFLSTRRLRCSK